MRKDKRRILAVRRLCDCCHAMHIFHTLNLCFADIKYTYAIILIHHKSAHCFTIRGLGLGLALLLLTICLQLSVWSSVQTLQIQCAAFSFR